MSTQQKTQQKLADIHMLVTYIKDHIEVEPAAEKNTRLDEIGKTTLEIASVLKLVESKTGSEADALFSTYRENIDKASDTIFKQLIDIKKAIDTDCGVTKGLFDRVEEVYVSYTGILESSSKQLELQRENYAKELHGVTETMEELTKVTKQLNDKVMTEKDLSTLLAGVETRITEVIEQDRRLNANYEERTNQLNQRIGRIQKSYRSLDETLVSVDESVKEAVGRMNVLLMQMEVLTGERGNK